MRFCISNSITGFPEKSYKIAFLWRAYTHTHTHINSKYIYQITYVNGHVYSIGQLGLYDKMPQTDWLKQQKCVFSHFGGWESSLQVPPGLSLVSPKASCLQKTTLQMATFCIPPWFLSMCSTSWCLSLFPWGY